MLIRVGLITLIITLVLLKLVSCDGSGSTSSHDNIPPNRITNLIVMVVSDSKITLRWSAPGNDGREGTAEAYEILIGQDSLSIALDSNLAVFDNPPVPKKSGVIQQCEISGLSPDTSYWFAIRAIDNNRNRSDISNIVNRAKIEPVQLRLELPLNNQKVADLITIRVLETGSYRPEQITIYGDNIAIGSVLAPPWEIFWEIQSFPHGASKEIYATAVGPDNRLFFSDTVRILVDTSLSTPREPIFRAINDITDVSTKLAWYPSLENDFYRYQLEWQAEGEPLALENRQHLYDRHDTTFIISNLSGLTHYDISLTVEDKFGHTSSVWSEIRTIDSIPPVVEITKLGRTSNFIAQISFESIVLHDFLRYEIIHSIDSIISKDDQVVVILTEPRASSWSYRQHDFSVDNFYYIRVVDNKDNRSTGSPVLLPAIFSGNWAIEFDGLNDLLVIPFSSRLLGTEEMTIEMWVYAESPNTKSALFCQSPEVMELMMREDYVSWGIAGCVKDYTHAWFKEFPEKEWVHLAITRSRFRSQILYINGVEAGRSNCGTWYVYNDDLLLGCRVNFSKFFEGMIDEVRIWSRKLSSSEILAHYKKEITGTRDGLVGYWPFNEGGGGVSIPSYGPQIKFGKTDQFDSSDPTWVLSTVPFEKD